MGTWILIIIFSVVAWVICALVSPVVARMYRNKKVTFDTPLHELEGTFKVDATIKGDETVNISEMFERMCILEPVKYKNDPRIPKVVEAYKALIKGKLEDTEGKHMPSEFLNGDPNPDYRIYLLNQKKNGEKWVKKEIKRFNHVKGEAQVYQEFTQLLTDLGTPDELITIALTDERINTYQSEDWKNLSDSIKSYSKEHGEDIVGAFLATFTEIDILTNKDSMNVFAVLIKNEVPIEITAEIVRGRITMEQADRIIFLVSEHKYQWEDAFEDVIEEDLKADESEDLVKKYRNQIRR